MRRILICTTILTTVKAFLIPHIKLLQDMGYKVDIAGNKDVKDLDHLVDNVYDIPFQRNPFSKLNITASRKLNEIIRNCKYDIIHFHTPVASAFGRWTAKGIRNSGTKVLYTAHGFHFYKGAPVKNWITYYPVEKFLSKYTDLLITINKEDYNRAKKSFKAKNIEYIPGVGLDTYEFSKITIDKSTKRRELGIPDDAFIVLSVGELNNNKNHKAIVKAIAKLNNPNIYYVICGQGELENYLKDLINELGLQKNIKLLGFRKDIAEIGKVSNIFAFPSFREGLSVAFMEAMALGLPVVCSNIRGNTDLIDDGKGGYLVEPNDIDGFASSINKILDSSILNETMGSINQSKIKQFSMENVMKKMEKIYLK